MIGFWGLNASISRYSKITDFMKIFIGVSVSSVLSYLSCYAFFATFLCALYCPLYLVDNLLDSFPRITWQLIYSRRKRVMEKGNIVVPS